MELPLIFEYEQERDLEDLDSLGLDGGHVHRDHQGNVTIENNIVNIVSSFRL